MKVILNACKLTEKEIAHDYLKRMLDFPDYYGRNLDALYDCLSERKDQILLIVNSEGAEGYFSKILEVMEEACKCILLS